MKYQILQGDNRETLKTLADNSIDAIVTDPPYGIDFLGKAWDANTGALETYQECLRVLKPGGHILAFSAARTYHHLAVTLEQAGFEIRDQIMWIYSSGFPKSQDIGKSIDRAAGKQNNLKRHDSLKKDNNGLDLGSGVKCPKCHKDSAARYDCTQGNDCGMVYKPQTPEAEQWLGWGTALKPAHEPIALARKPMKGSIKDNVLKHGTGALNIDVTRVPYANNKDKMSIDHKVPTAAWSGHTIQVDSYEKGEFVKVETNELGRFPSNVIGEILQADYQKYFYCPKVSRRERHIGHETPPAMFGNMKGCYDENGERYAVGLDARTGIVSRTEMIEKMGGYWANEQGEPKQEGEDSKMCWTPDTGLIYAHGITQEYAKWCQHNNVSQGNVGNNHPTVKPIELMKYLIKLITPPGGIVLDPFNGSGSTGCAAVELGYEYIGCELDPAYVEISKRRIEQYNKSENNFDALFE